RARGISREARRDGSSPDRVASVALICPYLVATRTAGFCLGPLAPITTTPPRSMTSVAWRWRTNASQYTASSSTSAIVRRPVSFISRTMRRNSSFASSFNHAGGSKFPSGGRMAASRSARACFSALVRCFFPSSTRSSTGRARRPTSATPFQLAFFGEFCARKGPPPVPGPIARNFLLPPGGPGLAPTSRLPLLCPHRVVTRAAEGTQVRHVQPPLPCHAERDDVVHRRRWRDSLALQASLAQVVVPDQHGPPEPLPRGALVERPRPLISAVSVIVPIDHAPVLPPLLVGPSVGRTIRLRRLHEFRTSWRSTRSLGSSHRA